MPRMPKIEFELGYGAITDIETQTSLAKEIGEHGAKKATGRITNQCLDAGTIYTIWIIIKINEYSQLKIKS